MRSHLVIALAVMLASAPGLARNIPGIVVAPEPSPGLVLILPAPGAALSSDARHTKGRVLAQQALAELSHPQDGNRLTKQAKLYTALGSGLPYEVDVKRMRRSISSCSVEAAADLPSVETPTAQEYYVVQLACPQEENPNFKMFAAVGLTDQAVVSVVLNVLLTPVWSERD